MKTIKKFSIIALILNVIIFLSMAVALFVLVYQNTDGFTKANFETFKYFTTDSNILMGLTALLLIPFNIKSITHEKECTPKWLTILNLVATTSVTLTLLTVVFFLAPIDANTKGYFSAFTGTNAFYHFAIPVLAIINFTLFETKNRIKFKHCFFAIIPMAIYACFYIAYQVMHMNGNVLDKRADFYHFVFGNSIYTTLYTTLPIMLIVTFLIAYLLFISYYFRRKSIYKTSFKFDLD